MLNSFPLFGGNKPQESSIVDESKHESLQADTILLHISHLCSMLDKAPTNPAILEEHQTIHKSMISSGIDELQYDGYTFTIDKWGYLSIELEA
jgi:hypothetical protein